MKDTGPLFMVSLGLSELPVVSEEQQGLLPINRRNIINNPVIFTNIECFIMGMMRDIPMKRYALWK
jgi:hypothetical protein